MRYKIIFFLSFIFFSSYAQKKIEPTSTNTIVVNTPETTLKFQTSQEKLETNPVNGLTYYWYKSMELHTTIGGYEGTLLNGDFAAYYLGNQLKEKGQFEKGLKIGEWKTWYENGALSEISNYKNGLKHGAYKKFDDNGNVKLEATYKNGKLHGEVKSFDKGKLLKTTVYDNGVEVVEEEKAEGEEKERKKLPFFGKKAEESEAETEEPEENAPEK